MDNEANQCKCLAIPDVDANTNTPTDANEWNPSLWSPYPPPMTCYDYDTELIKIIAITGFIVLGSIFTIACLIAWLC